jgi:hypothetical protein
LVTTYYNILKKICNKALQEAENALKVEGLLFKSRRQVVQNNLKTRVEMFVEELQELEEYVFIKIGIPIEAALFTMIRDIENSRGIILNSCDIINNEPERSEFGSVAEDLIAEIQANKENVTPTSEDLDALDKLQKKYQEDVDGLRTASVSFPLCKNHNHQSKTQQDMYGFEMYTQHKLYGLYDTPYMGLIIIHFLQNIRCFITISVFYPTAPYSMQDF